MKIIKAIYAAILNLYNRAEPIDIITVKAELEPMGKFEQVGGLEYLAELPEKVPTTQCLKIHKNSRRKRQSYET